MSHGDGKVPGASLATKLEQQWPPGGWDTLKLGFRILLFPGGSAAWAEQDVDSPPPSPALSQSTKQGCAGFGKMLLWLSCGAAGEPGWISRTWECRA